jgi:hypothetical protein
LAKIGRNDPCPCGSGKKFKKCHGSFEHMDRIDAVVAAAPTMRARHEAYEQQRKKQQGLGRPIVAAELSGGHRLVAVKNRLFHSKRWKTFHDFLIDYLKDAMGSDWGNAELVKPLGQRHPILVWYDKLCEQQRLFIKEPGVVATSAMTGAVAAYMHLAYDLYALAHNVDLQAKLIARLRDRERFAGARYEVRVAAMLVRAGFSIEFENEDDRSSTHCEFTATSKKTGASFSVEAKRAESGRVTRQLVRGLKKDASHRRIVFIDLNAPDTNAGSNEVPAYVKRAFDLLRRFEALDPQAQRLPPAYIVMTNTPWEHSLDGTQWRQCALADGFHIDEFKLDHEFPSLRAAIDGRQAHIDMHDLLKSMQTHEEIPSTFDGENPELAFADVPHRLLIGNKYLVPDADGTEVVGTLTSAVVMETDRIAMCAATIDDGRAIMFKASLSEAEMAAWKKHPDTFFGEVSRNHHSETALDFYDFLMSSYAGTPKSKLLEFMASASDFEELSKLEQPALASVYCERLATNMFADSGASHLPLLRSQWKPARKSAPTHPE